MEVNEHSLERKILSVPYGKKERTAFPSTLVLFYQKQTNKQQNQEPEHRLALELPVILRK